MAGGGGGQVLPGGHGSARLGPAPLRNDRHTAGPGAALPASDGLPEKGELTARLAALGVTPGSY